MTIGVEIGDIIVTNAHRPAPPWSERRIADLRVLYSGPVLGIWSGLAVVGCI